MKILISLELSMKFYIYIYCVGFNIIYFMCHSTIIWGESGFHKHKIEEVQHYLSFKTYNSSNAFQYLVGMYYGNVNYLLAIHWFKFMTQWNIPDMYIIRYLIWKKFWSDVKFNIRHMEISWNDIIRSTCHKVWKVNTV